MICYYFQPPLLLLLETLYLLEHRLFVLEKILSLLIGLQVHPYHVSAGFKEVDETGAKLEQQVQDIGKKYGIRIIGPNCLGIMSLTDQNLMNLTFLKITPKHGEIVLLFLRAVLFAQQR